MTTLLINKSTQEKWKLKNKKKIKQQQKYCILLGEAAATTITTHRQTQIKKQQQIQERKDRLFVSKNLNLYRFVAVSFAFSTEKVCSKKKVM